MFQYIKNKRLDFTARWIPSHLDNPSATNNKGEKKQRPEWVKDYHIKGNKEADRLASRAAELAELPEEIVDDLKEIIDMLHCVQNRLATIITHLPNRNRTKDKPLPKPPKASKDQAVAESEHQLSVEKMVVRCSVRLSKCSINSTCFWEFIKSKCSPANNPRNIMSLP